MKDDLIARLTGLADGEHDDLKVGYEARDEIIRLRAELTEARKHGYIVAMRLIQSDVILDDTERAAMDALLTKDGLSATLAGPLRLYEKEGKV